jgi:hypothetical protein
MRVRPRIDTWSQLVLYIVQPGGNGRKIEIGCGVGLIPPRILSGRIEVCADKVTEAGREWKTVRLR